MQFEIQIQIQGYATGDVCSVQQAEVNYNKGGWKKKDAPLPRKWTEIIANNLEQKSHPQKK